MLPAADVWLRSADAVACYPLIGMVSVGLTLMTMTGVRYLVGSPDIMYRPSRRHDSAYDISHAMTVEQEGRRWVRTLPFPYKVPDNIRDRLVHHLGLDGRQHQISRP